MQAHSSWRVSASTQCQAHERMAASVGRPQAEAAGREGLACHEPDSQKEMGLQDRRGGDPETD